MFQINVAPEDVNKFITEALVNATLGEKISDAINKAINEALHGYNSPVQKMAIAAVENALREKLSTPEWQQKMGELLGMHLTEEWFQAVMKNSIAKALSDMRDRDY